MKLSRIEFQKKLAENTLSLTFTGMSNCGKSYWSRQIAHTGFRRFCCDDMIETGLLNIIRDSDLKGIKDVARWLGQPYETDHQKKADLYLQLEKNSLNNIVSEICAAPGINNVIDTTGSFVFCGEKSCYEIKELSMVLYIKTEEAEISRLFKNFLKNPKPVIWNGLYYEPIEKSYRELLKTRQRLYEKYSDLIISSKELKKLSDGNQLLDHIYEIL